MSTIDREELTPERRAELRCPTHKLHKLKCWPEFFSAIIEPDWSKRKTIEIRRDDRGFEVGDTLLLREWDPDTDSYSDRQVCVVVTTTLREQPWVPEGYCAMSISHIPMIEEQLRTRLVQLEAENAELRRERDVAREAMELFVKFGPCWQLNISEQYREEPCPWRNDGCSQCALSLAYALAAAEIEEESNERD